MVLVNTNDNITALPKVTFAWSNRVTMFLQQKKYEAKNMLCIFNIKQASQQQQPKNSHLLMQALLVKLE